VSTVLEELLATIDVRLRSSERSGLVRARPGLVAEDARLASLGREERVWFQWHDGQDGTHSLAPDFNWLLVSLGDARDVVAVLDAEGIQLCGSPLLLMGNGGGDYLFLDRETSEVRSYWHEVGEIEDAFPSLVALAERLVHEIPEQPDPVAALDKLAWTRGRVEVRVAGPLPSGLDLAKRIAACMGVSSVAHAHKRLQEAKQGKTLHAVDLHRPGPGKFAFELPRELHDVVLALDEAGGRVDVTWTPFEGSAVTLDAEGFRRHYRILFGTA